MRSLLKCLTFFLVSLTTFGQHQKLTKIIDYNSPVQLIQEKLDSLLIVVNNESSTKELADIYHDIALHWHFRNWNKYSEIHHLNSAIECTKKAITLKSSLDSLDLYSLKRSYYNLGVLHNFHGDIFSSIDSHLKVVDMEGEDDRTMAAFNYLSITYKIIGDYQRAIECSKNSISVLKKIGGEDYQLVNSYISLAETYFQMGPLYYSNEIENNLNNADSIINVGTNVSALEKARVAQQRGNLSLMQGEHKKAIKFHTSVLDLKNLFSPFYSTYHLDVNLALVYNSLGVSFDKLGDSSTSLMHLKKAIALNPSSSLPYENIGDLYANRNQFKKGLLNYQKAIALAAAGDTVVKYDEVHTIEELQLSTNKTFLLGHLVAKANAWLDYFNYDGNIDHLYHALTTFERADQLIDVIRRQSTEYQTQLYWREQSANLYMKAVEACYLLNDPVKAYYFMERNKALLLLENISHENAKEIAKLPDSIAQREFELKRQIHLAENELNNTPNEQERATLRDSIFSNKRKYDLFLEDLKTSYADYARLRTQLEILSYDDFRSEYINDDQLVLQYILNEEQGYGILHTGNGPTFFEIPKAAAFNQNLLLLVEHFSAYKIESEVQEEYVHLSNAIFGSLLPENGFDQIQGKKLLVIPDYSLQRIPFEALVTQENPAKFLIEDCEVRYAYSISYLHTKKAIVQLVDGGLSAYAPVSFERHGLAQLGLSLDEVEGIKKIWGGQLFKEVEATKTTFLDHVGEYRIIHLSTHADLDENGNHWVAFKDEKLYLNEIYAHRNKADMIVLSACNTSRGDLKKGEGVMSLARAFFNSGAKSVVSSLWPVQDRAGKEVILKFYEGLDQGISKSEALRRAKQSYLENNTGVMAHPSFWASLIIIGDNGPLESSSTFWDYWPLAIAFIVFVAVLFIWYSRRSTIKGESS